MRARATLTLAVKNVRNSPRLCVRLFFSFFFSVVLAVTFTVYCVALFQSLQEITADTLYDNYFIVTGERQTVNLDGVKHVSDAVERGIVFLEGQQGAPSYDDFYIESGGARYFYDRQNNPESRYLYNLSGVRENGKMIASAEREANRYRFSCGREIREKNEILLGADFLKSFGIFPPYDGWIGKDISFKGADGGAFLEDKLSGFVLSGVAEKNELYSDVIIGYERCAAFDGFFPRTLVFLSSYENIEETEKLFDERGMRAMYGSMFGHAAYKEIIKQQDVCFRIVSVLLAIFVAVMILSIVLAMLHKIKKQGGYIGMLKAVGLTDSGFFWMYFTESLLLCAAAAIAAVGAVAVLSLAIGEVLYALLSLRLALSAGSLLLVGGVTLLFCVAVCACVAFFCLRYVRKVSVTAMLKL